MITSKIKAFREQKKMNQKDFSEAIGSTQSMLSYAENNKSEVTVQSVASLIIKKFPGTTMDDLIHNNVIDYQELNKKRVESIILDNQNKNLLQEMVQYRALLHQIKSILGIDKPAAYSEVNEPDSEFVLKAKVDQIKSLLSSIQ